MTDSPPFLLPPAWHVHRAGLGWRWLVSPADPRSVDATGWTLTRRGARRCGARVLVLECLVFLGARSTPPPGIPDPDEIAARFRYLGETFPPFGHCEPSWAEEAWGLTVRPDACPAADEALDRFRELGGTLPALQLPPAGWLNPPPPEYDWLRPTEDP